MIAIFKREFSAYFSTMVGYLVISLFLLINGLFIWIFPDSSILEYGYADMQNFFDLSPILFIFFIPAITMRSIAEERNMGTLELLLTRPLSLWEIVLGKFFACVAIVLGGLLPTAVYYYSICELGFPKGNIDGAAVFGSYIGLFFLGGLMTAIGIFASSISNNQIIAFILAVFFSFIWFLGFDFFSKLTTFSPIESALQSLSINAHYHSMSRGVIDSRDLIYFLSLTTIFLYFSKLQLERIHEK